MRPLAPEDGDHLLRDAAVRALGRLLGIEGAVGVARQFVNPEWLKPRLRPIFCVEAPITAVMPNATWIGFSEVPVVFGVDQAVEVKTVFKLESLENAQARLSMSGSGVLKEQRGAQDFKAKLESFDSAGTALWDTRSGALQAWRTEATWVATTNPQPDLATRNTTIQTIVIARLK